MKYIDADKLRAEIERQKKAEGWCEVWKDTADVYYARGFRFACDNLLTLIDSLQQEQPEVDLEKEEQPKIDWDSEIEEYWIATGWSKSISLGRFKVIARYFIGLALNAKKEE